MSITFPTSLDTLVNPVGADALANATPALQHHVQHDNANDAIEALETKIGVDGSADTSSLDYKSKHGSFIRATVQATTDSIAANASDAAKTLAVGKGCTAIKIATDYPAWVRIYASAADQTADSARMITVDPTAGTGVLLEALTAAGAGLGVDLAPAAMLYSLESSPGTTLLMTVMNKDSVSRAIQVTVTIIPLEG